MIKAKQNPDGTVIYSFETEPDLRMWLRVITGDSRKYFQEPYKPDITPSHKPTIINNVPSHSGVRRVQKLSLSHNDEPLVKSCVLTYFENHPELHGGLVNAKRSEALRELSANLQCPIQYIRRWVLEAGYSIPKHYVTDGSQYKYIYEHLDELIDQYHNNQLSMQGYHMDIFFYLSGMTDQVNPDSMHSIQKRVNQLGLNVRQSPNKSLPQ